MKMPSVTVVFDRRKVASRTKQGRVDVRVIAGMAQKVLPTGVAVFPKEWDKRQGIVKGRPDADVLNMHIQNMVAKISFELMTMANNDRIDLSILPELLEGKAENVSFIEYVLKRKEEKNVRFGTKQHFDTFVGALREYGKIKYFRDLTESGIRKFDEWLHKRKVFGRPYAQSTIYNYHKYLKQFINDAVVDGHVETNPYQSKRIKIDRGDKEHVDYLTAKQVEQLESLDLTTGYLIRTRDMFLFQCYTGLAYSDMMAFSKVEMKETDFGFLCTGHRIKTGSEYTLLLLPQAVALLKKYDWQLPRMNNMTYNKYLKVLGMMIGEPGLHSHQGRGAFATICLNKGMSADVLQRILGHKQISMTLRYATMQKETIAKEMAKLKG